MYLLQSRINCFSFKNPCSLIGPWESSLLIDSHRVSCHDENPDPIWLVQNWSQLGPSRDQWIRRFRESWYPGWIRNFRRIVNVKYPGPKLRSNVNKKMEEIKDLMEDVTLTNYTDILKMRDTTVCLIFLWWTHRNYRTSSDWLRWNTVLSSDFRSTLKFDGTLPHRSHQVLLQLPWVCSQSKWTERKWVHQKWQHPQRHNHNGSSGPMVPGPGPKWSRTPNCILPENIIVEDVQNLVPDTPDFFELFDKFRILGHAGQQEKWWKT